MKNWINAMKLKIEFALAVLVATACWLLLFPALGATSAQLSPLLLTAIIVGYATVSTFVYQLLYGAAIALGARYAAWKQTLIFVAAIAVQFVPQYLIISLLSLVTPELIVSYAWFAVAVVLAFVSYAAVMIAFSPLRDRADIREVLSKKTLLVWTHGCYKPVLKGTKLIDGERFLIAADQLDHTETGLKLAWEAMTRRDWAVMERRLITAIPELEHCGSTRILRFDAACRVMKQSHEALGNAAKIAEYEARIEHLRLVYREEHGLD